MGLEIIKDKIMKMTKKQMIAVVVLIIVAIIVYRQMRYDPLDDYSIGSLMTDPAMQNG